jgi:hypothetical protein
MKKCAFCTHPADSPEHVFSDWMLELLPRNEQFICNERIVSRDEYVRYRKRKIEIVAKSVCTPCNNTWMSDLENQLKPIFKDAFFDEVPRIFSPSELSTIAAFAFKTLVIANHKNLTTVPYFTAAQRYSFRRKLIIPNGVQVWMATRKVISGKYYGFWKSINGGSDQESPLGFTNYVCTWNFQNIILQVSGIKWKDKRRRRTVPMPSLKQPQYWDDAAIQIWPLIGGNVEWPPRAFLGDETLIPFRDRFQRCSVAFGEFI